MFMSLENLVYDKREEPPVDCLEGKKFAQYKESAKKRKIKFEITYSQFLRYWGKSCSYCGNTIKTIGLDRVDNTKGYRIDNIVSCCAVCNRMKMKDTAKDFINHCKRVSRWNNPEE